MYVTRVSFGTALIASLVIVYMAIIAITTSRDSNDDRGGGRYYGGGGGMFMPYYSPFNSFSLCVHQPACQRRMLTHVCQPPPVRRWWALALRVATRADRRCSPAHRPRPQVL